MKKLIEFIISNIIDKKDKLTITESLDKENGLVRFDIKTDPEEMGKIIGKRGKIIKAIRNLVRVKALQEGKRIILNLAD